MLKLLLDEHISPVIARQLRTKHKKLTVMALSEWDDGQNLAASDAEILQKAVTENLTLVTYDQRTIAPLLKEWTEAGIAHGGVIFIDERTVAPNDFGGLVRSLSALWKAHGTELWMDWVIYLRRKEV